MTTESYFLSTIVTRYRKLKEREFQILNDFSSDLQWTPHEWENILSKIAKITKLIKGGVINPTRLVFWHLE